MQFQWFCMSGKTNRLSDAEVLLTALNDIIEVNRHSSVMMAANI